MVIKTSLLGKQHQAELTKVIPAGGKKGERGMELRLHEGKKVFTAEEVHDEMYMASLDAGSVLRGTATLRNGVALFL